MKFLTTLQYLGNRLMKSIQTFFMLKVWTRILHPIGPDPTKIAEVTAK